MPIEAMFVTQNSATTAAYPLYDTHGNMTATLAMNSGGTGWTVANERAYDVWGGVRSGAATGGPKGRYVANLGHVQDDESGLIHMRARYYEPESGRFITEDSASDGLSWFIYCANSPNNVVDPAGNFLIDILISDMDALINNMYSAKASQAAGSFAKQKLGDVFAYQSRKLMGMFVAMEIEEMGGSFFESNGGIGYIASNNPGTIVHFDFNTSHHGYEHIDLQGKLERFQKYYQKTFGNARIPMDKFLDGFVDGFF